MTSHSKLQTSPTNQTLKVDSLSVSHLPSAKKLLCNISFDIEHSKVMALVGESGAGKSMITKVILGILPRSIKQTHGGIFYLGQDLQAIDEKARRELLSKEISMIPQDPLTAMNPVRKIKAQAIESIRGLGMDAKKSHDYLCEILSKIKIKDPELVMDYYPFNLSGGMRQRILIACAFAKKPKFIIADEPTTALDVTVQKDVLKLIKQMQSEYQTAMLFITHDLGVVANIADDVSVLFQGRVMESGDVETVINHSKSEYTKALIDASPQYFMNDLPKPIDNALIERLLKETDLYKAKNE